MARRDPEESKDADTEDMTDDGGSGTPILLGHAESSPITEEDMDELEDDEHEPIDVDDEDSGVESDSADDDASIVETADLDELPTVDDPPGVRYSTLGDLYLEHGKWKNPRKFSGLDDASLANLAASIARHTRSDETSTIAGVEDPFRVVRVATPTGPIDLIIDGQRRYLACQKAYGGPKGFDRSVLVPVIDIEPEPVELTAERVHEYLKIALRTVGTREGLSSPELVEAAGSLREAGDTLAVIATEIGRSESWVSKMLKAMDTASPQLALKWRSGQVTDEQFKELAAQKDPVKQKAAVAAVVKARESGDKGTSRMLAKETKALVQAEAKAASVPEPKPAAPAGAKARAARKGSQEPEQLSMPAAPPKKPPSMAVVADVLQMATAHPPTSDYVKGIMDGIKWDRGMFDAADFGKPWQAYLAHVKGDRPAPESVKKAKPAKAKKGKGGKKK